MQPKELEQWIGTQYGVSAEYPWAVSPENAVFRHRENKKWFALLLRVTGDKLGCPGTAPVWILNVKCDPLMIGSLCSFYHTWEMCPQICVVYTKYGEVAEIWLS